MLVRRIALAVMVLGAMTACGGRLGGGRAAGGSGVAWESDLAKALSRADGEGKLVMVDFYTDWCRWCDVLDQKTFTDAAVQDGLRRLITVKLDADRGGRDAARRYGVEGFPTMVFLDGRGTEVGRIPGYLPPTEFLSELEAILRKV